MLKRDIAMRIKESGVRPTPVMVEREIAALERSASILAVLAAVERAGGVAHYRAVDVTDADAVAALVDEIAGRHGRVDVLIHAAGVERSHFLPDKRPDEFDMVYDVKADGAFNLLKAVARLEAPPRAVVVFSSIAGRFGNAGQTDYSAANDMLCKLVSSLRRSWPNTKAIAIDWSAWEGVGMASRGSIPELMRRAGIEMLSPDVAAPAVRREIVSGNTGGEVVLAGALGMLHNPRDPDGGLDPDLINQRLGKRLPSGSSLPLVTRVVGVDAKGWFVVEADLDPQAEPFLRDHALDGTPLLPGVMGIEGFAEVASLIATVLGPTSGKAETRRPFCVTQVEDVRFESPVKFYRHEPRTITWRALVTPDGERFVAQVVLESTRELKAKGATQHTRHFSGRV